MHKKIIVLFVGAFLFFNYNFAFADVLINEIMYSSSGDSGEWIEVFNSGDNSIDLSEWRFFNNIEDSSPLRIQKGSSLVPSGGYAIITNVSNVESFEGAVFSSSLFSLPDDSSKYNTYKAISNSSKEIIDSTTYDTNIGGSKESGYSLSKINNAWTSSTPTPNNKNYTNPTQTNSVTPASLAPLVNEKKVNTEIPIIKTRIISNEIAFVGVPVLFQANTLGYSGENMRYGKYFWNFGDGDSKEQINNFDKFYHTYLYPGEYAVSLEYFSNSYGEFPETKTRIKIKVEPLSISISKIGDEKDFFIEIKNDSNYEIDISKWILSSLNKSFIFPKNTNVQSKSSLTLSPKITNFSILDKDNLKLSMPTGEIMFSYDSILLSKAIEPAKKEIYVKQEKKNVVEKEEIIKDEVLIDLDQDFSANVVKSDVGKNNYLFFVGFIILLAISSIGVYFIRRKKIDPKEGDDFEILDE